MNSQWLINDIGKCYIINWTSRMRKWKTNCHLFYSDFETWFIFIYYGNQWKSLCLLLSKEDRPTLYYNIKINALNLKDVQIHLQMYQYIYLKFAPLAASCYVGTLWFYFSLFILYKDNINHSSKADSVSISLICELNKKHLFVKYDVC